MKTKLFLFMAFVFVLKISAQGLPCRTSEENEKIYKQNPHALKEKQDFDAFSKKFSAERKSKTSKKLETSYVIPVVFHIYGDVQSGKTVTYQKIVNHLKELNDDFDGRNADYATVDPFFQARRGTLKIEFKLAKIDPNGGCSSGVVFHPAKNGYGNGGGYDDQIAADAWDNKKYMNVYIQNDLYADGTLNNSGVAWYPSTGMTASNTARVVFNGAYLYDNSYSKEFSATLTHEFGHFLNLIHTFEGGCTGTDEVDDTPLEDGKHTLSCTQGTNCNGDRVNNENYMGYNGAQGCYKMYTQGQIDRMLAALEHPARKTLWQESNLIATGVNTTGALLTSNSNFFKEAIINDGSFDTASTITLSGAETFALSTGTMAAGTHFTHTFPAGIIPIITVNSNSQLTVTLTGNATNHLKTNNTKGTITFLPAAFTGGTANMTCTALYYDFKFVDPYGIYFVDMPDATANAALAWKAFKIEKGDDPAFGAWRYAANALKIETYAKKLVCETGTRNISLLAANTQVGPSSNFKAPGAYPDQLDLRTTAYKAWDGKTGYVGFDYLIDGLTCYGWFKVTVDADGNGYTISEYAYNTQPGMPITTGVTAKVGVTLSPSTLYESDINDGAITSNAAITLSTNNGTFTKSTGTLAVGTDYSITGIPAGLTAILTLENSSKVVVTFTGKATSHLPNNNSTVIVTFKDAAITGGIAILDNPSKSIKIEFEAPYGIYYVDNPDYETSTATQWKYFDLTIGDNTEYGAWQFAANALKMETYGKRLVCETGTRNITKIAAGATIGASSNFTAPGAYPNQLDLRTATYNTWDNQTGYVGFEYTSRGRTCYGWMRVKATASGDGYTVTNFAYNTKPNEPITTPIINAPSNLTATVNVTALEVALTWVDNSDNETGFTLERALGTGEYSVIKTFASNVTSYTDTGLTKGSAYSYRMRANINTTNSDYSNVATVTIEDVNPNPTLAKPIINDGDTGIYATGFYVTWGLINGATSYDIQVYNETTGWEDQGTSTVHFLYINKQGTQTSYRVRMRAVNATGTSDWSTPRDFTLPGALLAPTNLTATANSTTLEVELAWTDNSDIETGFSIERALGNGTYSVIATLGADETSYTDTGLIAGNTYSYQIRTNKDATYSSYSNVATVTIDNANAPLEIPVFYDPSNGTYTEGFYATWALINKATSYEIQLYNETTGWATFGTSTAHFLYIIKQGTERNYRIRIRAVYANGESDWSAPMDVILPPTLGINESEKNTKSFAIFPNPASDVVNFSFKNIDTTTLVITIYNNTGALIDTVRNTSSYNVKNLPTGIYYVVLTDGTVKQSKKLVIK
ncbi:T9SS type A sorting domain-containing protein [Flavobacterium sp. F-65]|uniref:T9SS type A sorting domain-containing protein n=1 Tax=Flavobacterium pisciphilum TaxID=2893755 RepID=A0ABS8MQ75_9FLAO|nr:M43 family zinc metalloprotease [Flavobacterium sp. F-65]MCC9070277.1 T9SS type A sorting domain-containing protein [Flavobacterium sp. F-65]